MLTNEEKFANKVNATHQNFLSKTIQRCKSEALKEFQKLRRMQSADHLGQCVCITCKSVDHWKHFDAGHYISRANTAVAFSPINVNAQCPYCNQHKNGALAEYREALIEKFGYLEVMLLETLKDTKTPTLTKFQYAKMKNIYRLQQRETYAYKKTH